MIIHTFKFKTLDFVEQFVKVLLNVFDIIL